MRFISYDDLKPLGSNTAGFNCGGSNATACSRSACGSAPNVMAGSRVRSTIGLLNASANATRRRHEINRQTDRHS